jgi:phosphoribosylglycinamide formyltransferase-1
VINVKTLSVKNEKYTVLASGSGSNLQRIIDCIDNGEIPNAKVNLVVADRDCYALERAKNHNIPFQLIKRGKEFSENLEKYCPKIQI